MFCTIVSESVSTKSNIVCCPSLCFEGSVTCSIKLEQVQLLILGIKRYYRLPIAFERME